MKTIGFYKGIGQEIKWAFNTLAAVPRNAMKSYTVGNKLKSVINASIPVSERLKIFSFLASIEKEKGISLHINEMEGKTVITLQESPVIPYVANKELRFINRLWRDGKASQECQAVTHIYQIMQELENASHYPTFPSYSLTLDGMTLAATKTEGNEAQ